MTGSQLIFLDHFKHPTAEEENQDLIRFPADKPYFLEEVRIIPKGFPVKTPGKVTTGLTNPDSFELKVFLNNLNLSDPSRCQLVGTLKYTDRCSHRLFPSASFPTDGVILRGRYSGLTVAVVGVPAHGHILSPDLSPVQTIQKAGVAVQSPLFLKPQGVYGKVTTVVSPVPSLSPGAPVVSGAPIPTIGGTTGLIQLPHVTASLPVVFNPAIPPPLARGQPVVSVGAAVSGPPIFTPATPAPPAPGRLPVFDPTIPPPRVISSSTSQQPITSTSVSVPSPNLTPAQRDHSNIYIIEV